MADIDEFEEYRSRSYSASLYDRSKDDGIQNLPSSLRLKKNMHMRASFKSEGSYHSHHQSKAEPDMLHRLAEIRLENAQPRSPEDSGKVADCHMINVQRFGSTSDDGDGEDTSPEERIMTREEMNNFQDHNQSSPFRNTPFSSHNLTPWTPHVEHQRSLSCRQRIRRPRDLSLLEEEESKPRQRTYSMPNRNRFRKPRTGAPTVDCRDEKPDLTDTDFYRVRTFSTSRKGIINRGDSFKKKHLSGQSSSNDVCSFPVPMEEDFRLRTWSTTSQGSSVCSVASSSADTPVVHKVLISGSSGVGKTSLLQQFMTSEYMGNNEASLGK